MSYARMDFPPLDAGAIDDFTFDMSPGVATGETLIGAGTWEISAVLGFDASASSRAIGSPVAVGTLLTQRIGNCLGSVKYLVLVTVTTSAGRVLKLWSHFLCVAPN